MSHSPRIQKRRRLGVVKSSFAIFTNVSLSRHLSPPLRLICTRSPFLLSRCHCWPPSILSWPPIVYSDRVRSLTVKFSVQPHCFLQLYIICCYHIKPFLISVIPTAILVTEYKRKREELRFLLSPLRLLLFRTTDTWLTSAVAIRGPLR